MSRPDGFQIMNHTILILGISGIIGSSLYDSLSQTNHNIFGLCRKYGLVTADEKNIPSFINYSVDDLNRIISFVQPSIIINCIGCYKTPKAFSDVNVLFPHLLCIILQNHSLFRSGKKPLLVHISSIGVLGLYNERSTYDQLNEYEKANILAS